MKKRGKKKIQIGLNEEDFMEISVTETESETEPETSETEVGNKQETEEHGWRLYLNDLLSRLKSAIFDSRENDTLEEKIKRAFHSFMQWISNVICKVATKIPVIKDILPWLSHNG